MGFRIVLALSNDRAHEWENDPELGKKIFAAAAAKSFGTGRDPLPYGEIIEQVHADTQTVAILDGYGGEAKAWSHWSRGQTQEQRDVACLKALAEKLGYRVSKSPLKKV
jgi:hypothetical protein